MNKLFKIHNVFASYKTPSVKCFMLSIMLDMSSLALKCNILRKYFRVSYLTIIMCAHTFNHHSNSHLKLREFVYTHCIIIDFIDRCFIGILLMIPEWQGRSDYVINHKNDIDHGKAPTHYCSSITLFSDLEMRFVNK